MDRQPNFETVQQSPLMRLSGLNNPNSSKRPSFRRRLAMHDGAVTVQRLAVMEALEIRGLIGYQYSS